MKNKSIYLIILFCILPFHQSYAVSDWTKSREVLSQKKENTKVIHSEKSLFKSWWKSLWKKKSKEQPLRKYRKDKKGKLILRLAWLSILVAFSTIFFPIHIGSFLLAAVIISITSNIWARIERANGNDSWRIQSSINVSSLVLWGFVLFLFLLTLLILSFSNQEP